MKRVYYGVLVDKAKTPVALFEHKDDAYTWIVHRYNDPLVRHMFKVRCFVICGYALDTTIVIHRPVVQRITLLDRIRRMWNGMKRVKEVRINA